jgi:hypothetical protein
MRHLSRDQQSDDCSFPKRFARFQPMKPLDQNEAVFVRPHKNWSLLPDFQNTRRDFLNHFRFESFPPLHGNVDLVDREAFRFVHSFYSVVTEPALAGRMETPATRRYSNNIQLRTASVTILSLIWNEEAHVAPNGKSAPVRPKSLANPSSRGLSMMRRLAFGLALISVLACGSVSAAEAQAPNSEPDASQTERKLRSPGQIRPAKNHKKVSSGQSAGRPGPRSLPLSAAETYASEHSANAPVSPVAKPAPPAGNSWTGFYLGTGIGAAQQ